MSDYRRWRVEGGMFFFTVVTHSRAPLFSDPAARALLGDKFRACQEQWPFEVSAIVLLPDHLHAIWSLPLGDSNYPARWAWIKKEFTKSWLDLRGKSLPVSPAREAENRRGVWQPRFWEHTIEDEDDFENHFDYIHYNPVKHGYVQCPRDWRWSSFHRWVKAGIYPADWACGNYDPSQLKFLSLAGRTGE